MLKQNSDIWSDLFRFTQEPSSGNYSVLGLNYNYGSIVLVVIDVVNVMAAYQPDDASCVNRNMSEQMSEFLLF